eukprot:TRINITY_DN1595_c0_g1_i4.p2 TRINITY_DN1595_c0_g1~~TRINITY_DN1595_c0_g1_i4.p2  ORF type:complete len:107 (-),score=30.90 TRINITY_DN1595_c0_g1_i4:481-801(-)
MICGEEETANLLLGKFKWGHAFLTLNRELLKAYSECESGSDIISVQNSWLSSNARIQKPLNTDGIDADSQNSNTGSGSDNDSDDGLPPLEKNMNHLSLGETDDESE